MPKFELLMHTTKDNRIATPIAFRDLLISIAETAGK